MTMEQNNSKNVKQGKSLCGDGLISFKYEAKKKESPNMMHLI